MHAGIAGATIALYFATGCASVRPPWHAGLDRDSVVCLEVTKDAPAPIAIGYRTDYRQHDSVAFRHDMEKRLSRDGCDRLLSWQPGDAPAPLLVIPFYRDVTHSCEDLDARRGSGLLFARRPAAIRAPPA
jgi:hypothetical protein